MIRTMPAVAAAASASLLLGALVGAVPATARDNPHGPSPSCGSVVTTDVRLDRNLTCSGDVGLLVRSDVTIDLHGHRLTGPGRETQSTGIRVEGDHRVTVLNGEISGWGEGVAGTPGAQNEATAVVRRIVLSGNSFGMRGLSSTDVSRARFVDNATGIWVWPGRAIVDRSVFADNSTGAGAGDSSSLSISRSAFRGNELGIECAEASCTVTRSELRNNDTGLSAWLSDGEVRRNRFAHNQRGAYLSFETDLLVEGNSFSENPVGLEADVMDRSVVRDNTFRGNGTGFLTRADEELPESSTTLERNTFTYNTDGVVIGQPGARLGGNVATRNSGWGIHAVGAQDLGGNIARQNGNEPQCVGVSCSHR